MSVKIDVPSYLQTFTDNMEVVEVNGSTVGGCLNHLIEQFPDFKKMLFAQNDKLLSYLCIYLNEDDVYPDELTKPVKDGDELHITYVIVGG